jgi:hypothetical protein
MTDLLLELEIHIGSGDHCPPVLFDILNGLPADYLANRHNTPYQGAASLPSAGYPPRQGTCGFERARVLEIQLFLQSCKNSLASPEVIHIIL